jgi:heptose-I-phosphate ethanolaminephosphotransferase
MRVAEFDNAMAYNDSVVGAIIDQRSDGPTILFYFSDHGEDCWDLAPMEARNKQMPEDKSWLDRQYHVPFMVWMSDSFMAQYPDLAQRIRRAATRKGMLDNFGQFVLGISGIRTQYYRPTRDISSQQYQPKKRTTINGYELD